MNFSEAWERVKIETDLKTLRNLAELLEITQPSVSERKKKGKFPVEWAYTIGIKYNLSTDWIMTGEGNKKKNAEPKNSFLLTIDQWLYSLIKNDPGREDWFKYHFMDSFPNFKDWYQEKETNKEADGRQSHTIRENAN